MSEPEKIGSSPDDSTERDKPEELIYDGQYLKVQPLGLEHDIGRWPNHKQVIRSRTEESDGVILEYFPPDMDTIFQDALWGTSNTTAYFENVAEIVRKVGKPVYVIDPAHDKYFVALSLIQFGLPTGMAAGAAITDRKQSQLPDEADSKLNRRQFLQLLTTFGVSGAVVSSVSLITRVIESIANDPINFPPHQQNLRRAVIARGLRNLDQHLSENSTPQHMTMLYPPAHIKGIDRMIESPGLFQYYFSAISFLKGIDKKMDDSLFSIRSYVPDGSLGWRLSERIPIE